VKGGSIAPSQTTVPLTAAIPEVQPQTAVKLKDVATSATGVREVETPARHTATAAADSVTTKKISTKSAETSSSDAVVAAPVDTAPVVTPTVVVPTPVPVEPVAMAPVQEVPIPVETSPAKVSAGGVAAVKGLKGTSGETKAAARDTRSAEPKPAVDATDAAPVVGVAAATVQAPVATATHVASSAAPAAQHASGSAVAETSGIGGRTSETAFAGLKQTEANTPAATGTDLRTLVATPNVLEVGVDSGTHGWLRVRAEMGQMGQVTASVTAASSGAAEGLHKELPAISAYLAGERVGVSSLVVNAADKGAATQDALARSDAGTQTGTQDGGRQRGQVDQNVTRQAASDTLDDVPELDFGMSGTNVPMTIQPNGSGGWLSVRV